MSRPDGSRAHSGMGQMPHRAPSINSPQTTSRVGRRAWSWAELETMWRHPDMTAEELSEIIPGRSPKAIRRCRERRGRYRQAGVVPLCQRCGEHPVFVEDPQARRWGLCRECAQEEKEWRDRNDDRLRLRNDARRQRKRHRR